MKLSTLLEWLQSVPSSEQEPTVRAASPIRWKAIASVAIVTVGVLFTGYCFFFPIGVYGLLYDRHSTDVGFFAYGLGAPLRDYPFLSFVIVVALLISGLIVIFAPRLSWIASRWCAVLFSVSIAGLIICAFGINVFARNSYEDAVALRSDTKLRRSMHQSMHDYGTVIQSGRAPDLPPVFSPRIMRLSPSLSSLTQLS